MSIALDLPYNTGAAVLRAGLVLLPDNDDGEIKIDTNPPGLAQTTLKLMTAATNYPKLLPPRGTPCDQWASADNDTKRVLRLLAHLGAQQGGADLQFAGDSVIFEILCQGARFDGNATDFGAAFSLGADDPITNPYQPSSSTEQQVTIDGPTADNNLPRFRADIDYHAVDLHFEYVAKYRSPRPRFLRFNYTRHDVDHDSVSFEIDAAGTLMQLLINSVAAAEPLVTDAETIWRPISLATFEWLDVSILRGTGARFEQTPAGQFFHVLETAQIQLLGKSSLVVSG